MRLFGNGDFVQLTRAQRGWRCAVIYPVSTAEQFTSTNHQFETGSRWFVVALLKGLAGAWFAQRRTNQQHRSKRIENGWLVAITFLGFAAVAAADCNRARVIVQQHHAQAVVVQQHHAVTYNHAQAVQFVPVQISPDYYYSTQNHYRDNLLADAVVGRLVQAQIQALKTPQIQQQQAPCPCPQQNQPGAKASTGVNEKLVALVNARCIKCHQGPDPGGGLSLENLDAVPKGQRWTSHGLVNAGEMPKGGQPISDDEVKLFVEWAKAAR